MLQAVPLENNGKLSHAVVRYVQKTGESVVLGDALSDDRFSADPYIASTRPKSVLCVPVVHQGKPGGILYLENNLAANAFTPDRIEVMHVLCSQAAISLENARLYREMRQEIARRRQAEEGLRAALAEVETLKNRLHAENVYLQEEIRREHNFEEIVGSSPALLSLLRQVEQVAPTDSAVLIYGETGTGKEIIARAIHDRSPRRGRPLVKVNCGAISAGLVESELFGHVKGAFTGAIENRSGRFELADGGTLFLDEVSELPHETQVKLLRVLQEQEFEPVGSSRTVRVDVRIIAASNRDLAELAASGRFRVDLFYRLNVFPLTVPPLRERQTDIPQLVMFFLSRFSKKLGRRVDTISQEIMDRLIRYRWPGNIRELQNVIERAVVLSLGPTLALDGELDSVAGGSLAAEAAGASPSLTGRKLMPSPAVHQPPPSAQSSLEEVERRHILTVLAQTGWVIEGPKGAAKVLNLHPNTLRSRMKKLGIERSKREAL
jgi:formate hydrogenlyase transcriptional activator